MVGQDILGRETLDRGDVLVPAGSVGERSLVGALGQSVEDLNILVSGLETRGMTRRYRG